MVIYLVESRQLETQTAPTQLGLEFLGNFFFFFQKIIWPVLTHQIRIDFGHIKPAKAILLCWGWSTTSMVLGVISSYRIINNSIEEYAKLVYWAVDLYMFEKEGSMKWRKKHLEEMLLQQYWWNFWQFSK